MAFVFCDESGYTGDNLLDRDSAFFVYSSVVVDPSHAEEIVLAMRAKYRIQGELKAANLLKNKNVLKVDGGRAILEVLASTRENAQVIFFNKKYSLACKFYQYIFDDLLSDDGMLFYQVGFNRFISNAIYVGFLAKQAVSEQILLEFQRLMRAHDRDTLKVLFGGSSDHPDIDPVLSQILQFCLLNRERILQELEPILAGPDGGKWILDLSVTGLYTLLTHWGKRFDSLTVECDKSKPISERGEFLNNMIQRTDASYLHLRGETFPMTFNLTGPIQFQSSRESPGIQIADVLASSLCWALNNPRDSLSAAIKEQLLPSVSPMSIFPDLDDVDLERREPFINATVLVELVERSEKGSGLVDGIRDFIAACYADYPEYKSTSMT